jgi:glycosyltransferase involved in cell wall biosynthesis
MLSYIFIAFAIIVGIQSLYYFLFFCSSIGREKKYKNLSYPPISVIVCAKNEAENLKRFIPSILEQNYNNDFEIVLINDRSTDDTSEVINNFSDLYSNVKVVNVLENENFWGNKKYAVTLGIKAAKYENILFTDADCKPISPNWIGEMSKLFSDTKTIILGYGKYTKISRSFLNQLIRYETLFTAIQYFSYAKLNNPYMGVGRNLAYTKTDFFKVKGFIKHIKIKSGDDDLFINSIATNKNTAISFSKDSFTESVPKTKFKEWILQKRRHISTAQHYKVKHKFLLGLFYLSQILFLILAATLLSYQFNFEYVLTLIGIRYLFFYSSIALFGQKLNEKDLIILAPITEISLIFIQLYIYLKNKIQKPTHW